MARQKDFALTATGQQGFQGFWQQGLFRMICMMLVALWIRSEKATVRVNTSHSELAIELCMCYTCLAG